MTHAPSTRMSAMIRFLGLPALGLVTMALIMGAADTEQDAAVPVSIPVIEQVPQGKTDPASLNAAATHEGAREDSETYNQRGRLLARGKVVYDKYCVGCHGVEGDGNGPASPRLIVKPRDFTSGIYKFRTTDSSSLPMETDIHRTITRGLARVSMPAFPLMPESEKLAVVEYVKSFYPRWDVESPDRKLVDVPRAPQDLTDPHRIGRGRVTYLAMGCANCHGTDGAGTHATLSEFDDAWGQKVRAFNFTRGRLKGGDDPEDVYRTFHAGLRSVMPAFAGNTLAYVSGEQTLAQERFFVAGEPESLKVFLADFPESGTAIGEISPADIADRAQRNSWDLVAYVLSLRKSAVLTAPVSTNN